MIDQGEVMDRNKLLSTVFMGSALLYVIGSFQTAQAAFGDKFYSTDDQIYNSTEGLLGSRSTNKVKGDLNNKEQVVLGQNYFISADKLTVWSKPERSLDNLLGYLITNDQVKVVGAGYPANYVEVEVVKTFNKLKESEKFFVSYQYLSSKKVESTAFKPSQYFMVQNIASEKLRVYKKVCLDGSCPHKLILETDILVGEKTKDKKTMTNVGSYTIARWQKFYQTKYYPSWYRQDLPLPPKPGSSGLKWFRKKYTGMKGGMRGAFGWYTAKMTPNADGQWTHGTIGWGEDKKDFLERSKGLLLNIIADPRSHGCSRTDNESIAYIRELLDVGAEVVKIYAKEAYLDETLSQYNGQQQEKSWDYILTKNGRMVDGQKSDRQSVLDSKTNPDAFIEEGTYTVDQHPDVVEFQAKDQRCLDKKKSAEKRWFCEYSDAHFKIGSNHGNVYALRNSEMSGVFYVDAGMVKNYKHPDSLPKGGKRGEVVPSFMLKKN